MSPKRLLNYLARKGISQTDFASRLGVTGAAISKWAREGVIAYDRQCQIQIETDGELRASWKDAPKDRRPKDEQGKQKASEVAA